MGGWKRKLYFALQKNNVMCMQGHDGFCWICFRLKFQTVNLYLSSKEFFSSLFFN